MNNDDANDLKKRIADIEERLKDVELKSGGYGALYSPLLSVRNTELAAYWTRYNIQIVLNFGILSLIFKFSSPLSNIPPWVPIVGMFLAVIWLSFVFLSKRLIIKEWDKCVKNYEQDILKKQQGVPDNILIISQFKSKEEDKNYFIRNWHNLNFVACSLPIFCGLAWYLILLQIKCYSLLGKVGLGVAFGVMVFYLVWLLTKEEINGTKPFS